MRQKNVVNSADYADSSTTLSRKFKLGSSFYGNNGTEAVSGSQIHVTISSSKGS